MLQLKHIMDLEASQYSTAMSCALVGNYGLLTANVTALQATVSLT